MFRGILMKSFALGRSDNLSEARFPHLWKEGVLCRLKCFPSSTFGISTPHCPGGGGELKSYTALYCHLLEKLQHPFLLEMRSVQKPASTLDPEACLLSNFSQLMRIIVFWVFPVSVFSICKTFQMSQAWTLTVWKLIFLAGFPTGTYFLYLSSVLQWLSCQIYSRGICFNTCR